MEVIQIMWPVDACPAERMICLTTGVEHVYMAYVTSL